MIFSLFLHALSSSPIAARISAMLYIVICTSAGIASGLIELTTCMSNQITVAAVVFCPFVLSYITLGVVMM